MSLSYDLACAESDVAHINLDKEYNELITDIEAVYSHHRHTFKNSLGENSGEIIDLLIEHCSKDFFAYAALVYVLCVEAEMSNEAVLSYTTTYKQTLKNYERRQRKMRSYILMRLVEFYGEPNMTWGEFQKILKRLKNAKQ